ncbi:hypothetical protein PVAG01_10411 [Phlyctema vagabunda]|uniref:Uncharacterized protein n=1 Tax=Phlyctema vagabunda TaxID=108571 RepID=A0ABR4P5V0_9HELO
MPSPAPPSTLYPSSLQNLIAPLLASLPTAAVAPAPPTALLPLLSPILRQRVQLLSSASSDPWLPLLCYDAAKAPKLQEVVLNERLQPHPISNEVEIDWQYDVDVGYQRVDEETLHALIWLKELDLEVKCIWCVGDQEGGGDGWRIGEVRIQTDSGTEVGKASISEAEELFRSGSTKKDGYLIINNGTKEVEAEEEEEDDDDYWAQYDNTPARSPAPHQQQATSQPLNGNTAPGDDDTYYAQYASVQPAMDNHDPDEQVPDSIESSLGVQEQRYTPPSGELAHPRPGSSSSGEDTVARLEKEAARDTESREEQGVRQHIGTSIKSLFRLARVAGIDRAEFDRLVKTELECLGMMEEDD